MIWGGRNVHWKTDRKPAQLNLVHTAQEQKNYEKPKKKNKRKQAWSQETVPVKKSWSQSWGRKRAHRGRDLIVFELGVEHAGEYDGESGKPIKEEEGTDAGIGESW